jgi:hypothetical protein
VSRLDPPPGMTREGIASSFSRRVIREQPLDYGRLVAEDLLRVFGPVKTNGSRGFRVDPWQFQERYPVFWQGRTCPPPADASRRYVRGCERRERHTASVIAAYGGHGGESREGLASALRLYGRFAYVPGPLLLAGLIAGLVAAAVGLLRRRPELSAPAFLFATLGLTLTIASAAISTFSWRYQLPQLFLLVPAGVLAAAALLPHRRPAAPESASVAGNGSLRGF